MMEYGTARDGKDEESGKQQSAPIIACGLPDKRRSRSSEVKTVTSGYRKYNIPNSFFRRICHSIVEIPVVV
jgi:hypothetical protein